LKNRSKETHINHNKKIEQLREQINETQINFNKEIQELKRYFEEEIKYLKGIIPYMKSSISNILYKDIIKE
jgi:hypothetical protein